MSENNGSGCGREPSASRYWHRSLVLILVGLSFLMIPRQTAAQFEFVSDLLNRVTDVVIYVDVGALTETRDVTASDFVLGSSVTRGWGFELLIDLSSDSARADDSGRWLFELGLGYSYVTGFRATEPTLDLRGSIRGLPAVSVYAAPPMPLLYLGATVGRAKLGGLRGYDGDGNEFEIAGDTFVLGVLAGIETEAGVFVEIAYRIRDFPSVDWEPNTLPANWPRSLDFSSVMLSTGFRFGLR